MKRSERESALMRQVTAEPTTYGEASQTEDKQILCIKARM